MKENRLRPQKLITIVSLNLPSFVTFYVNFTDGEKDKEDLVVGGMGSRGSRSKGGKYRWIFTDICLRG